MSTKKDHRPMPTITALSLVEQLEDVVLALESAGQSEQDIFSLVNMIMRGFIRGGKLTDEYIALAKQARDFQEQQERDNHIRIIDSDGNRIN